MLIMDLSQVMIAQLCYQLGNHKNAELSTDLIRHMGLNTIRANRMKFKSHTDVVIACDSRHYWRKDIFPYYKAKRAENRKKSELDWGLIFDSISMIKSELKEFFPYRVIEVDGAEADDIIGVICQNVMNDIIILSADKDFKQLHKYGNVKQYDQIRKKFLTCNRPDLFLAEHIIRGDVDDGIPNILSADNCLVNNIRQKSVMQVKLDQWIHQSPDEFCVTDEMKRNYERNRQLIDLSLIPDEIADKIMVEFENQSGKNKSKLFNYFISHKLKHLMESIGDF